MSLRIITWFPLKQFVARGPGRDLQRQLSKLHLNGFAIRPSSAVQLAALPAPELISQKREPARLAGSLILRAVLVDIAAPLAMADAPVLPVLWRAGCCYPLSLFLPAESFRMPPRNNRTVALRVQSRTLYAAFRRGFT